MAQGDEIQKQMDAAYYGVVCGRAEHPAAAAAPALTEEEWTEFASIAEFVGKATGAVYLDGQKLKRLLAVAAHHRAERERWKVAADDAVMSWKMERSRAERAEAALRERDERIELVSRSLWSSLLEGDVSPSFRKFAGEIIRLLAGPPGGE